MTTNEENLSQSAITNSADVLHLEDAAEASLTQNSGSLKQSTQLPLVRKLNLQI